MPVGKFRDVRESPILDLPIGDSKTFKGFQSFLSELAEPWWGRSILPLKSFVLIFISFDFDSNCHSLDPRGWMAVCSTGGDAANRSGSC